MKDNVCYFTFPPSCQLSIFHLHRQTKPDGYRKARFVLFLGLCSPGLPILYRQPFLNPAEWFFAMVSPTAWHNEQLTSFLLHQILID